MFTLYCKICLGHFLLNIECIERSVWVVGCVCLPAWGVHVRDTVSPIMNDMEWVCAVCNPLQDGPNM